jgi:hypothetical protein
MGPVVPLLGKARKEQLKSDAVAKVRRSYAGANGDIVVLSQYPMTATWQEAMMYFADLASDALEVVLPLPLPAAHARPSVLAHVIGRRPIVVVNLLSHTSAHVDSRRHAWCSLFKAQLPRVRQGGEGLEYLKGKAQTIFFFGQALRDRYLCDFGM